MKKINEEKVIDYIKGLLFRCMFLIVIFLFMAIVSKKSTVYKEYIISNIYEKNFSFSKINNLYNKYFGGINPFEKIDKSSNPVFKESLDFYNESIYFDGVKLEVINNYLVPSIDEGMITFVGEKENYGNVIILTTPDDVNIWYGNIEKNAVKLYDYVSKGDYLGETKDNYLYLVFSKDNKFLNYKDYLYEN